MQFALKLKNTDMMTAGRSLLSARGLLLVGGSLLALAAPAAAQGPTGGTVTRDKAAISQTAERTVIRQASRRAIVDWKRFDVGRDHEVVFDQTGRGAATLNRVRSTQPSVIAGAIRAPGTVIIQNAAGVTFAKNARVDPGGMVAASQRVDPSQFDRTGRLAIGGGEKASARVVNHGTVTVGERGLAALVGGDVENAGVLVARRGTVALASGAQTTIDLSGDGLARVVVASEGRASNSGRIDAAGGAATLTADDAVRSTPRSTPKG